MKIKLSPYSSELGLRSCSSGDRLQARKTFSEEEIWRCGEVPARVPAEVSTEKGQKKAAELGVQFVETSAKANIAVGDASPAPTIARSVPKMEDRRRSEPRGRMGVST